MDKDTECENSFFEEKSSSSDNTVLPLYGGLCGGDGDKEISLDRISIGGAEVNSLVIRSSRHYTNNCINNDFCTPPVQVQGCLSPKKNSSDQDEHESFSIVPKTKALEAPSISPTNTEILLETSTEDLVIYTRASPSILQQIQANPGQGRLLLASPEAPYLSRKELSEILTGICSSPNTGSSTGNCSSKVIEDIFTVLGSNPGLEHRLFRAKLHFLPTGNIFPLGQQSELFANTDFEPYNVPYGPCRSPLSLKSKKDRDYEIAQSTDTKATHKGGTLNALLDKRQSEVTHWVNEGSWSLKVSESLPVPKVTCNSWLPKAQHHNYPPPQKDLGSQSWKMLSVPTKSLGHEDEPNSSSFDSASCCVSDKVVLEKCEEEEGRAGENANILGTTEDIRTNPSYYSRSIPPQIFFVEEEAMSNDEDCEQPCSSPGEDQKGVVISEAIDNEDVSERIEEKEERPGPSRAMGEGEKEEESGSSIYHAAYTESLMSNSSDGDLEGMRMKSCPSCVSGVDDNRRGLENHLSQFQGMTVQLEFKEDYDGDKEEFSEDITEGLEAHLLWANAMFVRGNDEGIRELYIPPDCELNSVDVSTGDLQMQLKGSRKRRQTERTRSHHKDSQVGSKCSSGILYRESSSRSSSNRIHSTNSDPSNNGDSESSEEDDNLSSDLDDDASSLPFRGPDDSSFLPDPSSGDDNVVGDLSGSASSVYDVDYMGRWDLFWPLMSKSERKMVGAPSELELEINGESKSFIVSPSDETEEALVGESRQSMVAQTIEIEEIEDEPSCMDTNLPIVNQVPGNGMDSPGTTLSVDLTIPSETEKSIPEED